MFGHRVTLGCDKETGGTGQLYTTGGEKGRQREEELRRETGTSLTDSQTEATPLQHEQRPHPQMLPGVPTHRPQVSPFSTFKPSGAAPGQDGDGEAPWIPGGGGSFPLPGRVVFEQSQVLGALPRNVVAVRHNGFVRCWHHPSAAKPGGMLSPSRVRFGLSLHPRE